MRTVIILGSGFDIDLGLGNSCAIFSNNHYCPTVGNKTWSAFEYRIREEVISWYANGKNELADQTIGSDSIIPFAVSGAGDKNPDLMYEIMKHLEVLFAKQKSSTEYKSMMNELNLIADEARNVGGNKDWQIYAELKQYQYDFVEKLIEYVPELLAKESFFKAAFK